MRILILTKHLHVGGISRYVVNLAKGLKGKNCDIVVASSGGALATELLSHNISHITVPINTKSVLSPGVARSILILMRYLKKHKIDIIHSHTRVTSFIGNLLAGLLKTNHITTVHGIYKKKLLRKIFPFLSEQIIAVSFETKRRLQEWEEIPGVRIKVVPNAVDVDYFLTYPYTKYEAREKLNLNQDAFILGNISRIEKIKGQEILLRAFMELRKVVRNLKLILVGEGKNRPELETLAETMGMKGDILFLGGKTDVRPFLRAMDVFCFTPYEEPFGIVTLEAMAMGVPLVATRVSDIPIITENGNCALLISPGNVEELKNAVLELYQNPHKKEALILKGLRRVKEVYSLPRLIEDMLKIYQRVLEYA